MSSEPTNTSANSPIANPNDPMLTDRLANPVSALPPVTKKNAHGHNFPARGVRGIQIETAPEQDDRDGVVEYALAEDEAVKVRLNVHLLEDGQGRDGVRRGDQSAKYQALCVAAEVSERA
jgi:hypothetical protein